MDPAVVDRLLKIVAEIAGPGRTPADLGPHTPLRDGGVWLDSVALLELIVASEAEFAVSFDPMSDFGDGALATVGSLGAVIDRRLREQA
jgi:acyl carrier protein